MPQLLGPRHADHFSLITLGEGGLPNQRFLRISATVARARGTSLIADLEAVCIIFKKRDAGNACRVRSLASGTTCVLFKTRGNRTLRAKWDVLNSGLLALRLEISIILIWKGRSRGLRQDNSNIVS